MRAIVLHGETNRQTFEVENHVPVADFDFTDYAESIDEALEEAYIWTQNLHDSWSRPGYRDNFRQMNLLKPLEGGYGHRSSMVGDQIQVFADGTDTPQTYVVASCGFERIS